jgi:hypothetical protein
MSIVNNNFTVKMRHTVQEIQGVFYQLVNMKITIIDGAFPILSGIEYVSVIHGTTEIAPRIIRFSADRKELHAGFSNNAFSGMTGSLIIAFGFGEHLIGNASYDSLLIEPLDPIFAPLTNSNNSVIV